MTPLRQRMIAAMQMRGFSPRTHESYLAAVRDLARFTRRSPDTLGRADLQGYFEHLVIERKLASASVGRAELPEDSARERAEMLDEIGRQDQRIDALLAALGVVQRALAEERCGSARARDPFPDSASARVSHRR